MRRQRAAVVRRLPVLRRGRHALGDDRRARIGASLRPAGAGRRPGAAGRDRDARAGAPAERHRRARPGARRRPGRRAGGAARPATRGSASRRCCCNASRRSNRPRSTSRAKSRREQIALRARRLSLPAGRVRLLAEIQLERIVAALEAERPQVAVIDSIQTLYSEQMQSAPGSVAQVRECAAQLTRLAKRSGSALLLIGHVTKEGAIAGPRVLEHIVDTVLYFEGDTHSSVPPGARDQEPLRRGERAGRVRDDREGLARGEQPFRAVPVAARARGRRLVRAGDARGHAPAAGRDPGAGRRGAGAHPAPAVGGTGAEPARDAARGAAPSRGHRHRRPGRVRQRGRRRAHRRAGGRPGGARSRWCPRSPTGRSPAGWRCSARSGSRARCVPRRAARTG